MGLFSKRVTFDQSDKGLIRTKGCFEKILTKSCLCQFPPNDLLAPWIYLMPVLCVPEATLAGKREPIFTVEDGNQGMVLCGE